MTTCVPRQDNRSPYRRRSAAARRLPVLGCGVHSDPWTCRCGSTSDPSDIQVDGYIAAAQLLLSLGFTPSPNIPAMRVMWRRGGIARELVQRISNQWEVAA